MRNHNCPRQNGRSIPRDTGACVMAPFALGCRQRVRCARPWRSHFKISATCLIAAYPYWIKACAYLIKTCPYWIRACCFGFKPQRTRRNALWFASPGCDPWGATGISRSDRFQPPRLHPCCRKFIGQGVPPFPSAGVHRGRAAWPPIHPVVESDVMDGQGATPAAVSQVRNPGSGSCTLGLWRTQRVWVRTLAVLPIFQSPACLRAAVRLP